jgi:Zn-dependent protease
MFGGGSIQLARVFGIRIGVDVSWFVVLFFFIFLLSGSFRETLDSSDTVAYLTAVASALLFFGSLILHELGHALVARRLGIGISGIDLWFFGGLAKMDRDADSPGTEFKIAIAGPLVTLGVVLACVAGGVALGGADAFESAAVLERAARVSPALLLTSWLATINTALFLFNLIPAFPLDGGRITRAIAWRVSGDRLRATRLAGGLGQGFSYLLMGLGLFWLVQGDGFSGVWLIVLGWFLSQAARSAVVQTAFTQRLEGVTVADIMDREPVSIPSSLPVARAMDEFFLRYRWPWFPVVDTAGRFIGLVREEQLRGTEEGSAGARPVLDVVESGSSDWRVGEDASLESLLTSEPLRRVGALMAVDGEGILRGVVTLEQVRRALHAAASPPTA